MNALTQVRETLRVRRLLAGRPTVLAAVSGGADSMALLRILLDLAPRLRLRVVAAHLDHGIRGESAVEDARFVAREVRRLGVRCIVGRADVPRRARSRCISIEMAAREARYEFLARSARRAGANVIATAHTADDQAETVLLKLARGAGPQGLGGIPYAGSARGVPVVRPLLDVTRAQIVAYLNGQGQPWREDETNSDPAHLRNRVRAEVLPLLERALNPDVRVALRRTAEIIRAESEWMDEAARRALRGAASRRGKGDAVLEAERLAALPLALRRRAIRIWLADRGVPVEALDFGAVARVAGLLGRRTGSASVQLPDGWLVRRAYGRLIAETADRRAGDCPFRVALNVPGETVVAGRFRVSASVGPGIVRERADRPGRLPARASISLRAVGRRRLYVRSLHPGDRFRPFGLGGERKLQDILVDAKVPRPERAGLPVLECAGEIAWVPGYRIAEGWQVPDGSEPALQIRIQSLPLPRGGGAFAP